MDTLEYVLTKYGLPRHAQRFPIEIPNVGRKDLARLFHLVGFTRGVEIGVERAAYSVELCEQNPGVQLVGVDAWQAYRGYRDHVDQTKLDRFYAEALERLKPFARATLLRKFSVDAAREFPDGSLDFVYIDACHRLESVIADLAAWSRKVRVGGIVAGHDYIKARLPSLMHVPQAIHAWTDAYQIAPWFVLGRRAKVDGEVRDDGRSWFYVQPAPVRRTQKGPIKQ